MLRICLSAVFILTLATAATAQWPTFRGNAERTGCVDGQPGPKSPQLLWRHTAAGAPEQFFASPAATDKTVIVTGLGQLNAPVVYALATDAADDAARVRWSRPPTLRLPVVASPALHAGQAIFGDGMHQTSGASLHAFSLTAGAPLWRLHIPGRLVHLEGTPTIAGGRIYLGGGHAGVLCLDPAKLSLDGRAIAAADVAKLQESKWQELLAQYEKEKRVDPDFAVPPSRDQLPQPSPTVVWQQGKDKWHVDAAVTVHKGRVLVPSAFLDAEKEGERAILALAADTGAELWKTPVPLNPWAGVSMAGDLAIVGTSSIRFDVKEIPHARGEVLALKAATGEIVWKKDLPGGVTSPIAIVGDLAIVAATDGKGRALNVRTGDIKWQFDARSPFFAGPAVAGDVAYFADLAGVVHARDLKNGLPRWKFALASVPGIGGKQVYGSPIVHGGRLYLATCQLDGADPAPGSIVCLGDK